MRKKSFWEKLKDTYEKAKKGTSVLLIVIAGIIEFIPSNVIPNDIANNIRISLLFGLSLIMLEIFFDMHRKLTVQLKKIKTITSNELLSDISVLLSGEKNIEIQYMGIAGRHGWVTVVQKLLDETSSNSLLEKKNVNIKIALINESVLKKIDSESTRYSSIESVVSEIDRINENLKNDGYKNIKLELYRYDHIPNFLGFLINGNYLYSTVAYWEVGAGNECILRGGGTDYIVYDKNDAFGGSYYIKRFEKWFEYATGNRVRLPISAQCEKNEY